MEIKRQLTYQSKSSIKKPNRKFLATVIILISVLISTIILLDYYYKNNAQNNFDLGFKLGNETGITIGFDDGYAQGVVGGSDDAYAQGVVAGYDDGYTQGVVAGYDDGYTQGEEAGYAQGLIDGAGTSYTIRDPTYQEMINFISSDKTDQNTWDSNDYVCHDFATDVKNNAFLEGYRCGFVYITFPNSDHGMVCFDTLDQGLIIIETQDDRILPLIVGEPLFDRAYYNPGYDDTVVDYWIMW